MLRDLSLTLVSATDPHLLRRGRSSFGPASAGALTAVRMQALVYMTKMVINQRGPMDTAALRSTQDRPHSLPAAGHARSGGSVTALVRPVEHPLGHLDLLESLAIFILREVAAESERPVLLFSGGKDSAVLLHLASKAFRPGKIPFPVLHVDTGHNFAEVLDYRDAQVEA